MLKSKTVWTGVAMVAVGLLSMVLPDLAVQMGFATDPLQMIGTGLGLIFVRLGIAKSDPGGMGGVSVP